MDGRDKASVEASFLEAVLQDNLEHPTLKGLLRDNQLIKHNYKREITRWVSCAFCGKRFEILLIPRQILYPKFCASHRSEYRRKF